MRPLPSLVATLGAGLVLLTACGDGGGASAPDVLPVEDVLAGGITITPDATGTAATLSVESSLPLACAVVYGTGDGFGLIATDDDMGGAAHTDHDAVMRGLAPETTYRYRLQGSDAAGNLYASEVMEFTTPAARAVDRPGEDVTSSATVTAVSSEFSDAFAATNAIDGDPGTEWSSRGDGDDASLTLSFDEPTTLAGIGVRSRSMGDGSAIIETFTVTLDDGEPLGPFDAGTGELTVSTFEGQATTVRIDAVTTTGGNTGFVDVELYGVS